jgi:hypothetical protein
VRRCFPLFFPCVNLRALLAYQGFASARMTAPITCPFGFVSSINSAADAPPTPVVLSHVRTLQSSLARSSVCMVAWSSCAPARTAQSTYCYGTMRLLSRPLRFPGTQRPLCPWGPPLLRPFTTSAHETLATWSICYNIRLKQMKHLEYTLATYGYGHCNICNIQIRQLQLTFKVAEIFKIYTYNIRV